MAMANTNGGKTTGKKLTKDQAKLAQVVQRIGAVDRKPAKATASSPKKLADTKKVAREVKAAPKKMVEVAKPARAAAKAGQKLMQLADKKSKPNTPTQGIGFAKNRTRNEDYINARNWNMDTAETPKDKAQSKKAVAKLDKTIGWASRTSGKKK
jgi:hypothetical protein